MEAIPDPTVLFKSSDKCQSLLWYAWSMADLTYEGEKPDKQTRKSSTNNDDSNKSNCLPHLIVLHSRKDLGVQVA